MTPKDLKICFLQAGVLSVLIALVVGFRIDGLWASRFAACSVMALINLVALTKALLAFSRQQGWAAFRWLCVKAGLLVFFLSVYMRFGGFEVSSFLAGLNVFLLVIVLRTLGGMMAARSTTNVRFKTLVCKENHG